MRNHAKCLIVGAGSAGISAALQFLREDVDFIVLDALGKAGGLIENARSVDNCVWVPPGSKGSFVSNHLKKRAAAAGIEIYSFRAECIMKAETGLWIVSDNAGTVLTGHSLLLAAGTVPRKLDYVPSDGNVAYELRYLQIPKSGRFVVIGGGDTAFDGALSLADAGMNVDILLRGRRARANAALKKEIESSKCVVHYSVDIQSIKTQGARILITAKEHQGDLCTNTDGLLICTGRYSALRDIEFDLLHSHSREQLEEQGCFMAGDVIGSRHRQVSIASGDGVRQAMRLAAWLR